MTQDQLYRIARYIFRVEFLLDYRFNVRPKPEWLTSWVCAVSGEFSFNNSCDFECNNFTHPTICPVRLPFATMFDKRRRTRPLFLECKSFKEPILQLLFCFLFRQSRSPYLKSGAVASATSAATASAKLIDFWSCDPSRRMLTACSSISRLPTTKITGTFASECSRTL